MEADGAVKILESVGVAREWLARGFSVLPCQPGTKSLVRGFGPNLQKLDDERGIDFWFGVRSCNLAVVAPKDGLILDFDDLTVYGHFLKICPRAAESYTETTPRGGKHVFLFTSVRAEIAPLVQVEIKRFTLAYPSRIHERMYLPEGEREILTVNPTDELRGLLTVKNTGTASGWSPKPSQGQIDGSGGLVAELKGKWPILSYLAFFAPKLKLTGSGRWMTGICPWHKDTHPSLWVDTERNLWGCHACGAHGDILNWHARMYHYARIGDAVRALAKYNVQVGV